MKITAHRIDRAYWRRRLYIRRFCGGFVVFLSLFQIYFWWRAPPTVRRQPSDRGQLAPEFEQPTAEADAIIAKVEGK